MWAAKDQVLLCNWCVQPCLIKHTTLVIPTRHTFPLSLNVIFVSFSINERLAEGVSLQGYCEVLEVLLGLEIVLQDFANGDFQKCFRQLYKYQQMCIAVEEQYF